jgi:hypothetical protein
METFSTSPHTGFPRKRFDAVLQDPDWIKFSRTSGHPIAFGTTYTGRTIAVVFAPIDADTIRPITAFDVEEVGE